MSRSTGVGALVGIVGAMAFLTASMGIGHCPTGSYCDGMECGAAPGQCNCCIKGGGVYVCCELPYPCSSAECGGSTSIGQDPIEPAQPFH